MNLRLSLCLSLALYAGPALSAGAGGEAARADPLRRMAATMDLQIGTATSGYDLSHDPLLLREFNIFTPENGMKWDATSPQPGVYDFRGGDAIAVLARAAGVHMRGESPVWYQQVPAWMVNDQLSRDDMIRLMREHITTVMRHYRDQFPGVVQQWDVVNEAVDECPGPARCGLRNSIWLQRIGPDYIPLAFQFAHEADPSAKLYYNDYDVEGDDPASVGKRLGLGRLLTWLQSKGTPIDGVGLQLHVSAAGPSPATLNALMAQIAALGLDIAVTELDVGLGLGTPQPGAPPPPPVPAAAYQRQAVVYRRILDACLHQPRCHTFVMWGVNDATNWRSADQPCIFDRDFRPKPAYFALRDRLRQGR